MSGPAHTKNLLKITLKASVVALGLEAWHFPLTLIILKPKVIFLRNSRYR
jgi:hypothetical protein